MRTKQDPTPPLAVSIPEAARLIGISRRTLYSLIADGTLPTKKLARRRLVPVSALNALLESAE